MRYGHPALCSVILRGFSAMNPLQARQRVDAVYTLKQADFASERQWNDYLEEKEEIIFNFTENIDVPATERKLRQYAEEHAAEIGASGSGGERDGEKPSRAEAATASTGK